MEKEDLILENNYCLTTHTMIEKNKSKLKELNQNIYLFREEENLGRDKIYQKILVEEPYD